MPLGPFDNFLFGVPGGVIFAKLMSAKSLKSIGKHNVPAHRKYRMPNPHKPYCLLRLWVPFLQICPKKYQKALRSPVKVDGVSRLWKMSKKALVLEQFGASAKVHKNAL